MTLQISLLLMILAASLVLFSLERIPADVTALGVLLSLILTGLLPADQAFAGFGSATVVLILGLLILTSALLRTGVVEMTGRVILRRVGRLNGPPVDGRDVAEVRHVGPVTGEHLGREGVDLGLPDDAHPGPLEAEVEAADALRTGSRR